jgi:hypothetical protein
MLELLFYSLAAFGLVYIVGHARISLRPREWLADVGLGEEFGCTEPGCAWRRAKPINPEEPFYCPRHGKAEPVPFVRWYHHPARWLLSLIECPACLGFWVGLGVGYWYPYIIPVIVPGPSAALALGLYTCAVGFLLGRATGLIRQ